MAENIEKTAQELQEETVEDTENNIKDDLQKLANEILRLREELSGKAEALLREKAEIDNLRKRHTKELEDTSKYAVGEFAKDLVEVMESLHRALEFEKEFDGTDSRIAGMFEGMNMTLKVLEKTFIKYGITRHFPIHEEFDHRLHQAISRASDSNHENNKIVNVIQAGYTIHDRLLKPALVIVNMKE